MCIHLPQIPPLQTQSDSTKYLAKALGKQFWPWQRRIQIWEGDLEQRLKKILPLEQKSDASTLVRDAPEWVAGTKCNYAITRYGDTLEVQRFRIKAPDYFDWFYSDSH